MAASLVRTQLYVFSVQCQARSAEALADAVSDAQVTCNQITRLFISSKTRRKSAAKRSPSSRDKVRRHRERLRAQGLRPIQIWVPDTRSPRFAAEARRQCELIAESPQEAEDQAFVDSISLLNQE